MNIYVSNLGFNMQDEDLNQLFAAHGTITSCKVIMDRMTNQSRGFGFVEMANDAEANTAIEALNGTSVDGRSIKVVEARPREEKPRTNNRW